jgi:hypothetical protein
LINKKGALRPRFVVLLFVGGMMALASQARSELDHVSDRSLSLVSFTLTSHVKTGRLY